MNINKTFPYLVAIIIFVIASVVYFNPVLKGQKIKQTDITQFIGMSKEINDYRAEKKEEPYWTGAAFSGMPAYQLSAYYPNDFIKKLDSLLRFLPRPADYVFLYFLGFFLLLIALNAEWKLAILGALAFGFSTYLIIIFGAGHNAKAHAIGYMPMVLAGVLWIFKKRYLVGFIVTAFAMGLEINANHPQMTYYLGFMILILGIIKLIEAIKEKVYIPFVKQSLIIVFAMVLGLGVNATRLLAMKEYADKSTRGKTELTIEPDGSPKKITNGLSKEYITEYSYGIAETMNLFIPRFMGGGTTEDLGKNTEFYKAIKAKYGTRAANEYSKQALTYWGEQTVIEAPAYIGAVLVFLFLLGAFLVKGTLKKWLVATTIFSIVLSWGKNFDIVTNLFIDFVPLYNKFRAVSSIQVIAEICIPLLGILALKEFFSKSVAAEDKKNALKKSFYILGGIAVFFILFGSSLFAFEGFRDGTLKQFNIDRLQDALIADRKAMLFNDSLRTLLLISAAFAILWFFLKEKVSYTKAVIAFGIIILFDLVSINLTYVNKDSFEKARNIDTPFQPNAIDKEILKDKGYYRVANLNASLFQDGRTSYFHKSIGGYHAAKLKRYQELYDFHFTKNLNLEVLNMLNTRYVIFPNQGKVTFQKNPDANGSAWFVAELKKVASANQEIKALDSLQTKKVAVIDASKFKVSSSFEKDTTATIQLIKYDVNSLTYQSNTEKNQFAVFSEIYYKEGWNAYVDGKLTPHFRVNYVLRGMEIPSGKHTIEFKFEPTVIKKGNTITLASYVLLLLIPVGWFFYKKKQA
ncbi:MAG: YfhO family protein [Flavobacteriaceae bacterium]|nr:YfhO family protein [Flavobacteriaceae bacterium]